MRGNLDKGRDQKAREIAKQTAKQYREDGIGRDMRA